MAYLGPHISISDDQILLRVLGPERGVTPEQFAQWPEEVQSLTRTLAGELFLVRSNPFVDAGLVRASVERKLNISRPSLSGEFPAVVADMVKNFWQTWDADQAYRGRLIERLRELLPENAIGDEPNTRVENATDATDLRLELPMLVLFPETTKQVQRIVRLANEMRFAIIPRGGGTGLTGGAIPLKERTVVLSLARFKKILAVDPQNMLICAEAGVITLDAIKAADRGGILFSVDPASKAASSIGGNISENSGGPFCFEYGTTIDNVLSYKMVTPTGALIEIRRKDHPRHKIFEGESAVFEVYGEHGNLMDTIVLEGDAVRKKGLGKDVSNKYLGGLPGMQKEGVDGIITEGCFICHPKLRHSRTLCLEFYGRSMKNAVYVIKDVVGLRDTIREQGDLVKISALEEFGSRYVKAIDYQAKSSTYEGDPISVLLLQLDSDDEAALTQAADAIVSLAQPYDGVDIFAARDDREAEVFWEDRHKLSAIARRTSGFKINEDIVIPMEAIPEFSDFLENLNLVDLAKAYRRALHKVRDLSAVAVDDPKIDAALQRCRQILKGELTAKDISDEEQEGQIRLLFRELEDDYPRLDEQVEAIFQELLARRIIIANHMHAGDGNCHVNLPVNSNDPEMLAEAHEAAHDVFKKVLELNGEVSGEHGIGITKIEFLAEDKIRALRAYKESVDPNGIINPGKLTQRKLDHKPYTFSFNRLINDLKKTALRDREQLMDLLRNVQTCTRCGKCKQVCPMFNPERGLIFHPRNKNISLGALIEAIYYSQVQGGEPTRELLGELRRIVDHCTACGKCQTVCPVKIDSAGAALQMRSFLDHKNRSGHPLKRIILHTVASAPGDRLPMAAKVVSVGQNLGNKAIGLIPSHWRRRLENPALQGPGPELDFRNLHDELKLGRQSLFRVADVHPEDTVLYFPGCGANLFSRSIGMATLYLLLKSRVNVVMPDRHMCCGYPLLASGCVEAYRTNRHRNIQDLLDLLVKTGKAGLKATTLLTACGTCRESLESYDFGEVLVEPPRQLDVVQFLLEKNRLRLAGGEPLLYHAACHTEWVGQHKTKAPEVYRKALTDLLGSDVALSPGCCGESGLGAVTTPKIYNKLRDRKKIQLEGDLAGNDGKKPVLVGCPSCKNGIQRCMIQMKRDNRVLHTVEYLAECVGGPKWKKELRRMLGSGVRQGHTVALS